MALPLVYLSRGGKGTLSALGEGSVVQQPFHLPEESSIRAGGVGAAHESNSGWELRCSFCRAEWRAGGQRGLDMSPW